MARDAYGFSLNYFAGDYSGINAGVLPFAGLPSSLPGDINGVATGKQLFNGNIAAMAVNIPVLGKGIVYGYSYDQLNRLVRMDAFDGLAAAGNTFTPVRINDYHEAISYDPNGNIQTYLRQGDSRSTGMDDLSYYYTPKTNQLNHVTDAVVTPTPADYNDLKTQSVNNYSYDQIGDLVSDVTEGISDIAWTVYGKIKRILKTNGTLIKYSYDAAGNRLSKIVTTATTGDSTYYVRDASGNVISVYNKKGALNLLQTELHLYGSSRLGVYNVNVDVQNCSATKGLVTTFTRGNKFFELSNHLGNVLATVSDKKLQVCLDGTFVSYYNADVVTANDYYPFGSLLAGRKYSQGGNRSYRYGFNGKENDNEVKGEGGQQDYGMRIYDTRLGRFLSVDPITNQFPYFTPYQFAGNTPIWATDLDGGEPNIALPRGLTFPDIILTLPKLGPIPVPPINPQIPPLVPQGFSMPQTPTLPPAPYMPVPPMSPSFIRSTPVDESGINPNDATTYPTPPFKGKWNVTPIKPGTKGYEKLKEKGATRLENERADILRWHGADKYHPKGHWDFKEGGNDNNPWENYTPDGVNIPDGQIYGKDFNPPTFVITDITTWNLVQYPAYLQKQYQSLKKQQTEYNKKNAEYDIQKKKYDKEMKKYKQNLKDYNEKKEQYQKDQLKIIL